MRRLIELGIPRGRSFWLGLTLASLEALSAVGLLALSTWLISAAAEQPAILYLNEVIVGVRAFALGRAFFRYTQRLNLHDAIFPMLGELRVRMFEATGSFIGIVGAGLIVFSKGRIKNLTTAAHLWLTAVIGLACGAGQWPLCGRYLR